MTAPAGLEWISGWISASGILGLLALAVGLYIQNRKLRIQEVEGDWGRLRAEITRLDARCDHLQQEVDDCREREGIWMGRAVAAESALLGEGEARQNAQRMLSEEREADAAKRQQGNGQ